VRYGLLTYSTSNLGDDIQSLAAQRFLPRVDTLIDRDWIDECRDDIPTALICSGWWTHRPATWPPPPPITPLLISMHICDDPAVIEQFTSPALRAFYEKHGPVGCRDTRTLDLLQAAGVPAYFSGCLTLTLPRYHGPREGAVVFVDALGPSDLARTLADAGDAWWQAIPAQVRRDALFVTHHLTLPCSAEQRFERARTLLGLYSTARLVVTSRIHCALPCLAMGTPVVMIAPGGGLSRLTGLCDLLTIRTYSAVIEGRWDIDWSAPPPPSDIELLRRRLTDQCASFVASFIASNAQAVSA